MLGFVISILFLSSLIYGLYSGNISAVSAAAVNGCTKAVNLAIFLAGTLALWSGIMKIADKSGITEKICRIISPFTNRLLKGIEKNPQAAKSVNMNITANLLGLGNAATPFGISAVKELNKENSVCAGRNTAIFTVLNTASIQLIPTTVAAIRLSHGSARPFAIIPAVIVTSVFSAFAGCFTAYLLYLPERKKNEIH